MYCHAIATLLPRHCHTIATLLPCACEVWPLFVKQKKTTHILFHHKDQDEGLRRLGKTNRNNIKQTLHTSCARDAAGACSHRGIWFSTRPAAFYTLPAPPARRETAAGAASAARRALHAHPSGDAAEDIIAVREQNTNQNKQCTHKTIPNLFPLLL